MISRTAIVKVQTRENPRRPGTGSWDRFDFIARNDSKTVGDIYEAGVSAYPDYPLKKWRGSLRRARDEGLVILVDPTSGQTLPADSDNDLPEEDQEQIEFEKAEEITFGLERDLQKALRLNLAQLEAGLTTADGGRERDTPAGRIDILARDAQGHLVVIELKAGVADRRAVGQILAYMGSLTENQESAVRGILIASDFDKRAVYAARVVPTLKLARYSFRFNFSSVT